jgi:hypothetical protein
MGWKNANLRSEMTRLLRRAGVSGWPRLFHSMRASRQTELQRDFPLHVVCSWLGNSPRIAQQSYLLVTEDDFARAAGPKVMVKQRVFGRNQTPLGVRWNSSFVLRLPAEPPSYYSPTR